MANLDEMILRAYITGDQLAKVKLVKMLKNFVDAGDENQRNERKNLLDFTKI